MQTAHKWMLMGGLPLGGVFYPINIPKIQITMRC
jgi:hypothetical protein